MSRIKRVEKVYDQELALAGQMRSSRREYVMSGGTLAYVAREVVLPVESIMPDRTPWWKREQKRTKRK